MQRQKVLLGIVSLLPFLFMTPKYWHSFRRIETLCLLVGSPPGHRRSELFDSVTYGVLFSVGFDTV